MLLRLLLLLLVLFLLLLLVLFLLLLLLLFLLLLLLSFLLLLLVLFLLLPSRALMGLQCRRGCIPQRPSELSTRRSLPPCLPAGSLLVLPVLYFHLLPHSSVQHQYTAIQCSLVRSKRLFLLPLLSLLLLLVLLLFLLPRHLLASPFPPGTHSQPSMRPLLYTLLITHIGWMSSHKSVAAVHVPFMPSTVQPIAHLAVATLLVDLLQLPISLPHLLTLKPRQSLPLHHAQRLPV